MAAMPVRDLKKEPELSVCAGAACWTNARGVGLSFATLAAARSERRVVGAALGRLSPATAGAVNVSAVKATRPPAIGLDQDIESLTGSTSCAAVPPRDRWSAMGTKAHEWERRSATGVPSAQSLGL